jgi:hypothetical protein
MFSLKDNMKKMGTSRSNKGVLSTVSPEEAKCLIEYISSEKDKLGWSKRAVKKSLDYLREIAKNKPR